MTTQPDGAAAADRAANDPAPPPPTATASTPDHHTDHVTAAEITDFLRHLTRLRSPTQGTEAADRAALLARKTELFTRIADQHLRTTGQPPPTPPPAPPTTPEGRTP